MTVLTAAIVGLGQVGSRFDDEPRGAVWSHAGAYLALADRFSLTGGADLDTGNLEHFSARVPTADIFDSGADMVRTCRPDVLSVCTPPAARADLIEELIDLHKPAALICEKPMDLGKESRQRIVDCCAAANVLLIVNYNRRFASGYRNAREAVEQGRIGDLVSVTVTSPNRLWSIGTHAANLLLYFGGDAIDSVVAMPIESLYEDGEPAADVMVRFSGGVAGRLNTSGKKSALILEVDVIGTSGRIRIEDDGRRVVLRNFEQSQTLVGYRTLGPATNLTEAVERESTFVNMMTDVYGAVVRGQPVASEGRSALVSEQLIERVVAICEESISA